MAGRFGRGMSQNRPKNIALHQQLGIDLSKKIPEKLLMTIIATPIGGVVAVGGGNLFGARRVMVDTQMKYRANFALNAGQAQEGGMF